MVASFKPQKGPVEFHGRNRSDAKRKALNYWYLNKKGLRLDIRAFSQRCRLKSDGRTIVFYPAKT